MVDEKKSDDDLAENKTAGVEQKKKASIAKQENATSGVDDMIAVSTQDKSHDKAAVDDASSKGNMDKAAVEDEGAVKAASNKGNMDQTEDAAVATVQMTGDNIIPDGDKTLPAHNKEKHKKKEADAAATSIETETTTVTATRSDATTAMGHVELAGVQHNSSSFIGKTAHDASSLGWAKFKLQLETPLE